MAGKKPMDIFCVIKCFGVSRRRICRPAPSSGWNQVVNDDDNEAAISYITS